MDFRVLDSVGSIQLICDQSRSAQFKPGTRLDRIHQFQSQSVFVLKFRQLQKVHARAGGRQTVQFVSGVMYTECREELLQILNRKVNYLI